MDGDHTQYRVTVHPEDGSYWAEVAELPGCFASGQTMDELWEAVAEAIGLYLSSEGSDVRVKVEEMELSETTEQFEAKILVG